MPSARTILGNSVSWHITSRKMLDVTLDAGKSYVGVNFLVKFFIGAEFIISFFFLVFPHHVLLYVVVLMEYFYSFDIKGMQLDEEDLVLVQGRHTDLPRLAQHGCPDQGVH